MQKKKELVKSSKVVKPVPKEALAYMSYFMNRLAKALREDKKA